MPYPSIISVLLVMIHSLIETTPTNWEHPSAKDIVTAFHRLGTFPDVIEYTNNQEVNRQGGHLQGVQWVKNGEEEYVVMSGSSSTYSYYAVVKMDGKNEVLAVHKLLDKPYKHAGGFQIQDQYMAVGIEDNEARDKSKVHVYRFDDPEHPPQRPLAVIERTGEYERATAGGVGVIRLQEQLLVVVGDWSSRHLDFYLGDDQGSATEPFTFKKVYTINAKEADKKDWINPQWYSYQNINLIKDRNNKLYLIGLARNEENQDVADLFRLETKDLRAFVLKKVTTKKFKAKEGTSFQWGAGVTYDTDQGRMRIISCTDQINKISVLNVYH